MSSGKLASLVQSRYCPSFLRGLAISAYGWRDNRRRYTDRFSEFLAKLRQGDEAATEDLVAESRRRAVEYSRDALGSVPWYASRIQGGETSLDPLATLPIISKRDVAGSQSEFAHQPSPENVAALVRKTSGSTGQPLEIPSSLEAVQMDLAVAWRHREWHGCPRGVKTATIAGHPIISAQQERPPFWVMNRAQKQLLFSSYHISKASIGEYAKALSEFRPQLIHGYPSAISLVAVGILDSGLKCEPTAITTSSEMLLSHQREVIRRAFGVEPRSYYGNAEGIGKLCECEAGRFHVREEQCFVEFVRGGQGAESARLVGTGYWNQSTVLIRYDTGDKVLLSDEATCPCGRSGRLVRAVSGRVEDYIIDGEGRFVGRLDHLLKGVSIVNQAQIIQDRPGVVEIRVDCLEQNRVAAEQAIRHLAAERLAPSTTIEFEFEKPLIRGAAAKVPFIVSNLGAKARHPGSVLD